MKKIWWIVGVFIFFILIIFWVSFLPAKGTISKKSVTNNDEVKVIMAEYSDENIRFKYQNKYELVKDGENIRLIGKSGVLTNFTITLNDFVGSIDEVSGVKMRQIKKEEYLEEKNEKGLVFVKQNPFEMSAFILNNGRSLTVSMSANGNDEEKYRKEFDGLMESLEFFY